MFRRLGFLQGRILKLSKKEEEQSLLGRSRDFLQTADYQTNNGLYGVATFSLEQALELFLKSKILVQGSDHPKIHSVKKLLELLFGIASEREIIRVVT